MFDGPISDGQIASIDFDEISDSAQGPAGVGSSAVRSGPNSVTITGQDWTGDLTGNTETWSPTAMSGFGGGTILVT